ncbi:MAG: WD40/YVTN/BNR-like repeat-containing protein [Acidobacteriota bacterium]
MALTVISLSSRDEEDPEAGESEAGGGALLDEWLYQQRAYPLETIPIAAGEKMLEQVERLEVETAALMQRIGAGTPSPVWVPLGPEPILYGQTFGQPRNNVSGRISALALDPRYDGVNNRTIYLGGAQGGLWRTDDNGENWRPLTDDQKSQAIGAIAVDPKAPDTIYVGLGEGSRCALCYYGSGLLKSTDGGRNWRQITGPISPVAPNIPVFTNAAFTKIAIDPVNTATIYVTTTYGYTAHPTSSGQQVTIGQVGLWRSNDGGENWTNLDPGGTNGLFSAHDVAVDPLNPNIVYAGMRTIGIYRSLSKGSPGSWQLLSRGLPDVGNNPSGGGSTSPYRRVALAIGPPVAPSTASTI